MRSGHVFFYYEAMFRSVLFQYFPFNIHLSLCFYLFLLLFQLIDYNEIIRIIRLQRTQK